MQIIARVILRIAGALIAAGGFFDLFTPRLPRNLQAACTGNESARKLIRELLRALGGALIAIGIAVLTIVIHSPTLGRFDLLLILPLVVPAEGVNTVAMYRAGSPWQIPAAFVLITAIGLLLAL